MKFLAFCSGKIIFRSIPILYLSRSSIKALNFVSIDIFSTYMWFRLGFCVALAKYQFSKLLKISKKLYSHFLACEVLCRSAHASKQP